MNQSAPSPSSFTCEWAYDVFLNFRGEDTRYGFTGNLRNALDQRGIFTFIDDDGLESGDEITPSLLKAIEESRIAITVFSRNYASSTFCLDELVKILECVKGKGRLVWPIFFDVDPSDVRHQRGSFEEAFTKHEERFKDNMEKVQLWRSALFEAANFAGFHYKPGDGYESRLIERVIQEVSTKIKRNPLHVAYHPVGLESRVLEVTSLLGVGSDERVNMVGIYGIGGIGKSTLARAVYNWLADQFEGSCFLDNVREKSLKDGLVKLQETLLYEIVGEMNLIIGYVNRGIPILKRRLGRKKILLILDDVDELEQLRAIAGEPEWFGTGSRIMITTRDKHLLANHGVERTYEVEELNLEESLQLFSWNAFKKGKVDPGYVDISNRAILYAQGLPLALEIMGRHLFGKSIDEWKSALDKYERTPDQKLHKILRVSYDSLHKEEQEIFLDIACFLNDSDTENVTKLLEHGRDINPKDSIRVLIDKSLIKIEGSLMRMHHMIQDTGREIVQQESPKEPGKRSRLWFYEDILHVLVNNTGTDQTEIIMLYLPQVKEVSWSGTAFKKMKNLKVLIIHKARFSIGPKHLPNSLRVLDWSGYPSASLPPEFCPKKLVILNLSYSCITLDKTLMMWEHLSHMDFRGCEFLSQVPDLSGVPNLTELNLSDCTNLIEIHDSVGFLVKLRKLSASFCINLRTFPPFIKSTSLECLLLIGCKMLQSFPEILERIESNDIDLRLDGSAIEKLPLSIGNLVGLKYLSIRNCRRLVQLPSSIAMLPKLRQFDAESCTGFRFLNKCDSKKSVCPARWFDLNLRECGLSDKVVQMWVSCFRDVRILRLSDNNFTVLPECIRECHFLMEVELINCKELREIRGIPTNIIRFFANNCTSLTSKSSSIVLNMLNVKHALLHRDVDGLLPLPGGRIPEWLDDLGSVVGPARQGSNISELLDHWIVVPGTRIPEWLDHCNRGPSVSFWARKKFPAIALCEVLREEGWSASSDPTYRSVWHILINGKEQHIFASRDLCRFVSAHVLLTVPNSSKLPIDQLSQQLSEDEWSHVEVLCTNEPVTIKWTGVYIHRGFGYSMEDIRFINHDQWTKKKV